MNVIDPRARPPAEPGGLRTAVGAAAVLFSTAYIVSDVLELARGGFSPVQLVLTYLAEAALPLFVLGLYAVQRPRIGRLGLLGALGYAYAYIYFTGTVTYSLVEHTPDWATLTAAMGPWLTAHGAVMVAAGVCFGLAVVRAGVFPRWTGYCLIAGVCLVAATTTLADPIRFVAATVRALAFVGMGMSLLRGTEPAPRSAQATSGG